MFYDVTYTSPSGVVGTHYAVEAESEFDASSKSPIKLCYGTPWTPDQFTVNKVIISTYIPEDNNNAICN